MGSIRTIKSKFRERATHKMFFFMPFLLNSWIPVSTFHLWNLYYCYSHSNYMIYGKIVGSVETGEYHENEWMREIYNEIWHWNGYRVIRSTSWTTEQSLPQLECVCKWLLYLLTYTGYPFIARLYFKHFSFARRIVFIDKLYLIRKLLDVKFT